MIQRRITGPKLDQQIKSLINRSKDGSTDQNFNQQVKGLINRSKDELEDQK